MHFRVLDIESSRSLGQKLVSECVIVINSSCYWEELRRNFRESICMGQ